MTKKIRILVIGMVDSPHFARWLEQFRGEDVDIRVFPSSPNRRIHVRLSRLIAESHDKARFNSSTILLRISSLVSLLDLVLRGRTRQFLLSCQIKSYSPDIIHAIEIQHAGYLLLEHLRRHHQSAHIVLTNYGSDLYWFGRFPHHERKLRALLARTDFYGAECIRDLDLAREYGFTGQFLQVVPNAGGVPLSQTWLLYTKIKTSSRSIVLIKGYTNFVGRAQDILLRLGSLREEIPDANFVVYSSTIHARLIVWWLKRIRNVRGIVAIPKRGLSHEQMLDLFSQARLYVGFSKSDGISTSMLEAMSVGCVPLQTNTACIGEWQSKGAKIIPLDVDRPNEALRIIASTWKLGNDLDEYAQKNRSIIEKYLDTEDIKTRVKGTYQIIAGSKVKPKVS